MTHLLQTSQLSLKEFLNLSSEEIATIAPPTMLYYVSGSRREAALAGIEPNGNVYKEWASEGMLRCINTIFQHGVHNLLMPMATPGLFSETTPQYREFLWDWINWGLGRDEIITQFIEMGWQVHLPFGEYLPKIRDTVQNLHKTLQYPGKHSLWIFVIPEHNILWDWALKKLQNPPVINSQDAILRIYGEDIQPATLYLDFGKPIVSVDLLPPFLIGKLEAYWSQRPGYSLTEHQFRCILYDYAYVRQTWQKDKTGRAEQAITYRGAWENGPTLGLGQRLGPFWYPQPTSIPEGYGEDEE